MNKIKTKHAYFAKNRTNQIPTHIILLYLNVNIKYKLENNR